MTKIVDLVGGGNGGMAGQEQVAAAASAHGWTECDYSATHLDPAVRSWFRDGVVVNVKFGERGQVLSAWAFHGEPGADYAASSDAVIGAVTDGRSRAGRTCRLFATAAAGAEVDEISERPSAADVLRVQRVANKRRVNDIIDETLTEHRRRGPAARPHPAEVTATRLGQATVDYDFTMEERDAIAVTIDALRRVAGQ